MVVLAKEALEKISLPKTHKPSTLFSTSLPIVNLSDPCSDSQLITACEDLGFFKVTNHGIPSELMARLEAEAVKFFALSQVEKEKTGGPNYPSCYGNRSIGSNGDVGWVEYLLFQITSNPLSHSSFSFLSEPSATLFRSALDEYISAVRKLACQVLDLISQGLKIEPRNSLSKLLMDDESDSVLRLNHYPPCPIIQGLDCSLTGFGEHTDPQIIAVMRSNDTSGLEISLRDGSWVSVPPDQTSFFINVGDSLQVLTNGRFRSVRHRVLANPLKQRVSMVYFGAPPCRERLAPLTALMGDEEKSLYREFTWSEYKRVVCGSRLGDNRILQFEK